MFKPRLFRFYATKPPSRFPDPLRNALVTPIGDKLSFIHRPPPAAPTPHSTTLAPASPLLCPATPTASPLPPLLRPSAYKPEPERLSKEDVEKLRTLRRSNPDVYTCAKLAKMFNCTPSFVSQVAALPRALRRAFAHREQGRLDVVRSGWGERKATARAIRERRRQFW